MRLECPSEAYPLLGTHCLKFEIPSGPGQSDHSRKLVKEGRAKSCQKVSDRKLAMSHHGPNSFGRRSSEGKLTVHSGNSSGYSRHWLVSFVPTIVSLYS